MLLQVKTTKAGVTLEDSGRVHQLSGDEGDRQEEEMRSGGGGG